VALDRRLGRLHPGCFFLPRDPAGDVVTLLRSLGDAALSDEEALSMMVGILAGWRRPEPRLVERFVVSRNAERSRRPPSSQRHEPFSRT
jgi:hypothetical protein